MATETNSDYENDGTVDDTSIRTLTYDENNNLILQENDNDADGVIDSYNAYSYTYEMECPQ